MLSLIRRCERSTVQATSKIIKFQSSFSTTTSNSSNEEFRVLELIPNREVNQYKKKGNVVYEKRNPKTDTILPGQDWQGIWPTARTFHPGTVPFPVRQGYKHNKNPPPDKHGNAELMKIPNFLHLTPPVIKRHCEAIKKFCTKWPEHLKSNEDCNMHFPVEIITSDYCYSSPTIREPLARIVSLQVKLSSLHLDAHAKDKMLRLVGDRYNPTTDLITITADRCPTKKQNLDYVTYLLTALYHVSWNVEPWESEKSEADMEYYDWDKSKSRSSLVSMYCWPRPPTDFNYEDIPYATEYKVAISDLINDGEDEFSINKYGQAVKRVLNLKSAESTE